MARQLSASEPMLLCEALRSTSKALSVVEGPSIVSVSGQCVNYPVDLASTVVHLES